MKKAVLSYTTQKMLIWITCTTLVLLGIIAVISINKSEQNRRTLITISR